MQTEKLFGAAGLVWRNRVDLQCVRDPAKLVSIEAAHGVEVALEGLQIVFRRANARSQRCYKTLQVTFEDIHAMPRSDRNRHNGGTPRPDLSLLELRLKIDK